MDKIILKRENIENNREAILEAYKGPQKRSNRLPVPTKRQRKLLGLGKDMGVATAKYIRITPRKVKIVADLIKGKSLDEALELTNKAVVEALDGLPARKIHCSVLAEDAIKAALVDYYTRSGREMPESLVGFEPHED